MQQKAQQKCQTGLNTGHNLVQYYRQSKGKQQKRSKKDKVKGQTSSNLIMASVFSLKVGLDSTEGVHTQTVLSKLMVNMCDPSKVPSPTFSRAGVAMYLLCLEPVLQLEPQLVGLALDDAGRTEAGTGLHAQGSIAGTLPHGVEAGVLHGCVAALCHLSLSCVLLGENRSLLLHQDARLLARESLWIDSLALQKYRNNTSGWWDVTFHRII